MSWTRIAAVIAAGLGVRHLMHRRRAISLEGATVVVTGGSRGLGLEMARELVEEGAQVALLARDPEELDRAQAQLGGEHVTTAVCDVTEPDQVRAALAQVLEVHGRIDALINNAGRIQVAPLSHLRAEDFDEAMALHFRAMVNTTEFVVPHMVRQGGGRIVNIASLGGHVAIPHLAPYCASKFAAVGFSDALRTELSRHDIYVTTVSPGLMRTGSHVQARFRGRPEAEFAWFSLGASAPLVSMNARRAAARIVRAMKIGQPALFVGWTARLLAIANALAPSLTGDVMAGVNRLLPAPRPDEDAELRGRDIDTRVSPSPLTTLADRAAERNNELGQQPAPAG